jgi:DNA invertase Pin-like site-specific DNA recombinase
MAVIRPLAFRSIIGSPVYVVSLDTLYRIIIPLSRDMIRCYEARMDTLIKRSKIRLADMPHMVGYARVSMSDQKNQRQVDELVGYGVAADDIFSDTASGKNMKRPGWTDCWRNLQKGDLLVVVSLDRIGRDLLEVIRTVRDLRDKQVNLKVLNMDIDTRTPIGEFAFHIMAAFAHLERQLIVERTMHGLEKARERGVVGGAKPTYSDAQIIDAMEKENNNFTKAANRLGATRITMFRRWKAIQDKLQPPEGVPC